MPIFIQSLLLSDIKLESQEPDFSRSVALGVSESKTDTNYSFSILSFKEKQDRKMSIETSLTYLSVHGIRKLKGLKPCTFLMSLQSNPPLSHSVKVLKGILIHTSLTILWAPVSTHLGLQAAALPSDLKDAERLVHLKHEFCQLWKLFLKKLLLYKHCPAYPKNHPSCSSATNKSSLKSSKIITQKKSLWDDLFSSILLSPSEVLHTFYGQKCQQNMYKP